MKFLDAPMHRLAMQFPLTRTLTLRRMSQKQVCREVAQGHDALDSPRLRLYDDEPSHTCIPSNDGLSQLACRARADAHSHVKPKSWAQQSRVDLNAKLVPPQACATADSVQ